jgi:hypothetical protein
MDEFVFAGLAMIAVTLLAMSVMDVLAALLHWARFFDISWRRAWRVAKKFCPSPRGLAGHCVFDYTNNGGDDGACYTATDRLTKQLTDVDAAGRTLKNRQQYSKQRAAARAAKCAGNGVSDCAEVNILDSSAGRIAADCTGYELNNQIDKCRWHDFSFPCFSDGLFRLLPSFPTKPPGGIFWLWFQGLNAAGMQPCTPPNKIACASSDEHRGQVLRGSDRSAE